MVGGAWWAAIYGVAQSRTQLKQLSISSSKSQNQNFHGSRSSKPLCLSLSVRSVELTCSFQEHNEENVGAQ